MLRKYGPFLTALAVFAGLFIWSENAIAPRFQSCIREYAAKRGDQEGEEKGRIIAKKIAAESVCTLQLIDRHNGFFSALAAFAVALFTWTLWRSSEEMWVVTKKSADTAERALTVVERAFCAISSTSNTTISVRGVLSYFELRIGIANSGRTAATRYCARANVVALDAIPADFRFPDYPGGQITYSVITPRSESYIPARIAIQDAIAMHERRKRILIYGWLEYDDVFENTPRRRTEYCFEIDFYTDPRTPPVIISGKPIPVYNVGAFDRYNACDDDCRYKPGQTPVAIPGELPEPTIPPGVVIAPPQQWARQRCACAAQHPSDGFFAPARRMNYSAG